MVQKKILVGSVLRKVHMKRINLLKSNCPNFISKEYNIPARTATTQNQGLSCFVPRKMATVLENKISVSANGDFCAFWHDTEFTILQDSYALEGRGFRLNQNIALYLISAMYTALSSKYNWNNKSGWEKIKQEYIVLPIRTDVDNHPIIDETCFYHHDGFIPDFDYMQERIAELEQERIAELEQYLVATGLNDCMFTDDDRNVFSRFSLSQNSANPHIKYFSVSDLFVVEGTKSLDAGKLNFQDVGINFVGRTDINNGIQGKIAKQMFEPNVANTITATVIGNYKYVKFQQEPYYCSQNINKLTPKFEINENLGLWFRSEIQKFVSLYDGQQGGYKLNELKGFKFPVPVQTDANNRPIVDSTRQFHPAGYVPDWAFMDKYMQMIKKLVVADVVKYKDDVIDATKQVVFDNV